MFVVVIFCAIGSVFGDSFSISGPTSNGEIRSANPPLNPFEYGRRVITKSSNVLKDFDKAFNQRTELDNIIHETDQFQHFSTEYSSLVTPFVGEVKTLLLNSHDSYSAAPRLINDWCSQSVSFLEAYVELFSQNNEEIAAKQEDLLKDALETGVKKTKGAISMLVLTSSNFDAVINKLNDLRGHLSMDYAPGSNFVRSNIRATETETGNNVPTLAVIANATTQVVRQATNIITEFNHSTIINGVNRMVSNTQPIIPSKQQIISDLKNKFDTVEQFYSTFTDQVVRAKTNVDRTITTLSKKIEIFENFNNRIAEQPLTSAMANNHSSIQSSVSSFKKQCENFRTTHSRMSQ